MGTIAAVIGYSVLFIIISIIAACAYVYAVKTHATRVINTHTRLFEQLEEHRRQFQSTPPCISFSSRTGLVFDIVLATIHRATFSRDTVTVHYTITDFRGVPRTQHTESAHTLEIPCNSDKIASKVTKAVNLLFAH